MNTMYTKRMAMALSLCCSAVVLVACGSSSSSSSNVASATNDLPTPGETTTEPTAPGFSWNTSRNQSVTISGIGQTVGVRITNPDSSNESITVGEADSGGASYTATYGDDGRAPSAVVKAGGETIELPFSEQEVTAINGTNFSIDEFGAEEDNAGIEMANPYSAGWDYQTFGFWSSAPDSSGRFLAGPISVGRTTDGADIPPTGTAIYTGFALGKSVVDGAGFDVVSEMRAQADFANRSIAFSTTNTLAEPNTEGATFSRNSSLDMTGTLTHAASTNAITGAVTTTGGLSGTVNARFYGPGAEEIGGTFALGSGNNAYSGGFGGKR